MTCKLNGIGVGGGGVCNENDDDRENKISSYYSFLFVLTV